MIGKLQPIETEIIEGSNISGTKENTNTANSLVQLPSMPPESSFQQEQINSKQSILLQIVEIPQEAKDKLFLLLEGDFNSLVSKSPMGVGGTNPIAHKAYTILLKNQ